MLSTDQVIINPLTKALKQIFSDRAEVSPAVIDELYSTIADANKQTYAPRNCRTA